MRVTLILAGLCALLALAYADDPPLKNGPSGWQKFKGNRGSKTITFMNTQTKGRKKGSQSGSGGATGNSANLDVQGQKLASKLMGRKGAEGSRNGEKADAKDTGNKNYQANGKGRTATADVAGNKVESAKAGGKEIKAEYIKSSKSVKATDSRRNWDGNLKGKLGTAVDQKSGKKATLNGIRKGAKRVQGKAAGKRIVAGSLKRKSELSYATVPKKRGRGKVRYTSQTKKSGRKSVKSRVVEGKLAKGGKEHFANSANRNNELSLLEQKSKKLATIKAMKYQDVPCQKLKNNMWARNSKDFKYHEKTLKVDYPQQNGEYVFPSCMDISVDVTLPKGVRVKDLAAALTVMIPGCGEFSCGKERECLDHQCFYKSLCGENIKPSGQHKDPAKYLVGQTDTNVCGDNFPPGGKVKMQFHYCPDVESTMAKDKRCKATFTSTIAISSMQVQIDTWLVKKRPLGCALNAANRKNVRKLGCKRVLIDYKFKWKNLPDIGGISTAAGKLLDTTNCNLGKRPCVGHDSGFLSSLGK